MKTTKGKPTEKQVDKLIDRVRKKDAVPLKRCPFCGESAAVQWYCGCITYGESCGDKGGDIQRNVFCGCGAETKTIKQWNKRVK